MTKPMATPRVGKIPVPDVAVMTVRQISRRWGCTEQHVIDLIDAGQLQALNIGSGSKMHWRIPREAIVQFEAENSSDAIAGRPVRKGAR